MTWRTSPIVILIRHTGRYLGFNRAVQALLHGRLGYEERFGASILGSIDAGDVVWDIGANVGFYSGQFARSVGDNGRVFAFEPSPENLKVLTKRMESYNNVTIVPGALGSENTTAFLKQSSDDLGVTSRIVTTGENTQNETFYEVEVWTGDGFVEMAKSPFPNLIKIDAEGSEVDILKGMDNILSNQNLRTVFMEVHFSLLKEKGMPNAPKEIEKTFLSKGFQLQWIDFSHLVAKRNS